MLAKTTYRGYADGKLVFEETFDDNVDPDALFQRAQTHADRLLAISPKIMMELEFLDISGPERFLRFGTDPDGMVIPIPIDLSKWSST